MVTKSGVLAGQLRETFVARTFSLDLRSREPRVVGWIRSGLIAVAVLYAMLAAWGMDRRIWQVQRIELSVSSTTLSPRSTVSYGVITSGDVQTLIRLELVPRVRSVTLLERRG